MFKLIKYSSIIISMISFFGLTIVDDEQKAIEYLKSRNASVRIIDEGIRVSIVNRSLKPSDKFIGDNELDGMVPLKKHLNGLLISSNRITEKGYNKLYIYTNLEFLDIDKHNFNDNCASILIEMKKLRQLRLEETNITDKTLDIISNLKKMEVLDLNSTRISDSGLVNIIDMNRLQYIELNRTGITDKGLEILSKSKSLLSISLDFVNVTDIGAQYLLHMKNIVYLSLRGTKISSEMCEKLQKGMSSYHKDKIIRVDY
jgi:internalin A